MLVRFSVGNYKSIANEIALDLRATHIDDQENHVATLGEKEFKILRVAALYGANASGKSNIVEAIAAAKNIIRTSLPPNKSVPIEPFRLDKTNQK